jgi:hypothetical protein
MRDGWFSLPINPVAADVRRLILFRAKKRSEPHYVGCYGSRAQGAIKAQGGLSSIPDGRTARVKALTRTMLPQ